MKSSIIIIILVLLSGCTTFRLEPPALLQGQKEAVIFHGHDKERKEGKKVSVEGLPEILARATWVDHNVYHKGGIRLRFSEGQELLLPHGFDFFLMGKRGHFEIRKEDVAKYREVTERIEKEFRSQ